MLRKYILIRRVKCPKCMMKLVHNDSVDALGSGATKMATGFHGLRPKLHATILNSRLWFIKKEKKKKKKRKKTLAAIVTNLSYYLVWEVSKVLRNKTRRMLEFALKDDLLLLFIHLD